MLNSENEYEVFAQINAAAGNTVSGNYAFPDDYRDISITLAVTATVAGKETAMSPSKTYYRQNAAITAYEIAKANGFEGSVEEWLDSLVGADGKDGQDGNGISDAYINPSTGELTLVLDDGTETVLGNVVGSNGVDGRGINSIELNENGEWVITYTDNTTTTLTVPKGTDGKDGIDGKDGADGKDGLTPHIGENGNWWIGDEDTGVKATGTDGTNGVGLAGMAINEKGEIIVTLDNGATLVIGKLISDILPLTLAPLDDNILNLGETIYLKAIVNLPENASVIWTASNDNFQYTPSDDGKSCEIIPQNVGETVFTVFVVDAKVNIISAVAIQTVSVVGRHAHIDEDADNQCDICGEKMQSDILRSDANLDGQITAEDARLALRAAVNLDSLDAAQIKAADINLDGVITAEDARAILRQAVGLTV